MATTFWAWLVSALIIVLLAVVLPSRLGTQNVLRDARGRYSLSRLQMTLWTVLILSALIAIAVSRVWVAEGQFGAALTISIPPELLQVMGISYASAAAAPAVLALKTETPSEGQVEAASTRLGEPLLVNGQAVARPAGASPVLVDLVRGDELATAGTVDLSKVQQLAITALVVTIYGGMLFNFFRTPVFGAAPTQMPKFSEDLVTLLLISHGGYLAWKAAPKPAAPAPQRPPPPVPNVP